MYASASAVVRFRLEDYAILDTGTASCSTGSPAGPAGCGVACIVLGIVILLMGAFAAGIIWCLRGVGQ
jgi:hypothetical protein